MTIAITAGWEHLEEGSPEERACFAAIGIRVDDLWLTEAQDTFVNRVRQQVHLSAYRLAEWIAWNWWRLRWEPRSSKRIDWASAHHLPSVGGGYVWPNLTVFSDGERVALISSATASKKHEPIRYLSDSVMAVQASVFFNAVDGFIEQVLGQLSAEGVAETNLGAIWSDVQAERQDIEMSRWRQVEALLGYDPDEASPHEVEHVIQGDLEVGGHGFTELAAARKDGQSVKDLSHLKKMAATQGVAAKPSDAVKLSRASTFGRSGVEAAWRRGAAAAKALRKQEALGDGHLKSSKLAALAGVSAKILDPKGSGPSFSYALDDASDSGRVVLRKTTWVTNRRFDLARLLGDRLFSPSERLLPVTSAQTYRQKWQRAFAAELLCPAAALIAKLDGDVSRENIESAAEHYEVAGMIVTSLLADHGLLAHENIAFGAEAL